MIINIFIKSIMLRLFYLFSIVILISEPTKTNARNTDYETIQRNVSFSNSAHNRSKTEEMCNSYIMQSCNTTVSRSIPTSNFTELGTHSFIVGGKPSKPKEYPHMALIGVGRRWNVYWICGGSLISENFVLSAAHCTESELGSLNKIRLGELNLASTRDDARTVDYTITRIIVHPDYNSRTNNNDIALLKFKGLFSFTDYIRPICLNTLHTISDQEFIAVGWGRTSSRDRGARNELRSVELNPQNDKKCKSLYRRIFKNDTMLCVGYAPGGKDTCQGDSGGPLQIINKKPKCPEVPIYTQIGITSFGEDCGRADTPGVYTRVSHFIPWIESVVWN